MYSFILLRVVPLALGQSYDCPSASDVTLKDMHNKVQCQSTTNYNKQCLNSWDQLYQNRQNHSFNKWHECHIIYKSNAIFLSMIACASDIQEGELCILSGQRQNHGIFIIWASHLNLKSCQFSPNNNINFSYRIILKNCTGYDSITATFCAKF